MLAMGLALALPARTIAHGEDAPAPTFPDVLLLWRPEPILLIALAAAAIGWVILTRRVSVAHPAKPHPGWRSAAFLSALAVLALALISPIEAYEGQLFSVHMLQHMLIELVAAPLLLLGAPATLALRAATPSVRARLLSVLHSRAVTVLSFPLVAWVLFALSLIHI